jgi:hypothetical protein
MKCIEQIRRATDPRLRWTLALRREPARLMERVLPEEACAALRRLYHEALDAAGFEVADAPPHSLALREIARRGPGSCFRLLYGVHAERGMALLVLGERLERDYYGDSVRRAERLWFEFLGGSLRVNARGLAHR